MKGRNEVIAGSEAEKLSELPVRPGVKPWVRVCLLEVTAGFGSQASSVG